MKWERCKTMKITDITVGRLKLTTYKGSPWLGVELMWRMLFITLFGRRFEFRWLDKEKTHEQDTTIC